MSNVTASCESAHTVPSVAASVAHIVGSTLSWITACRILYVYARLRVNNRGGHKGQRGGSERRALTMEHNDRAAEVACNFYLYRRASACIRSQYRALYGTEHPATAAHDAAGFTTSPAANDVNRSITTIVSPDRPGRMASAVGLSAAPPMSTPPRAQRVDDAAYYHGHPSPESCYSRAAAVADPGPRHDALGHNFSAYGPLPAAAASADQHQHDQLVSLQGVTMLELNRWVSRLHNPLNDCVVVVIILELFHCLSESITSSIALSRVSSPQRFYFNDTAARPPSVRCVELVLSDATCDWSATSVQFFDASALAMLLLLAASLASRRVLPAGATLRWRFTLALTCVAMMVGCASVGVMWGSLKRLPWGTRFTSPLPWCWVPDDSEAGPNGKAKLLALRLVLSYSFPVLIIVAGAFAYRSITRAALAAIGMRFSGLPLSFVMPRSYRAILRRALPQVVMLLGIYGFGAISRVFSAGAAASTSVFISLAFSLLALFNAVIWAHGEGILRPAVGMGNLEDAVGESFSQLVLDCYGLTVAGEMGHQDTSGSQCDETDRSRPPSEAPTAGGTHVENIGHSFAGSAVGY